MDNYNYDDNDSTNKEPKTQSELQPVPRTPFSTAALVFGILAVPACITIWFGIIFAIAAIVCAIIARLNYGNFNWKSGVGLVLGIVFLALCLLLFFSMLSMLQNPEFVNQLNEIMQQYEQYYPQSPTEATMPAL